LASAGAIHLHSVRSRLSNSAAANIGFDQAPSRWPDYLCEWRDHNTVDQLFEEIELQSPILFDVSGVCTSGSAGGLSHQSHDFKSLLCPALLMWWPCSNRSCWHALLDENAKAGLGNMPFGTE
jgi:hypothetical protein